MRNPYRVPAAQDVVHGVRQLHAERINDVGAVRIHHGPEPNGRSVRLYTPYQRPETIDASDGWLAPRSFSIVLMAVS